MQSDIHKNELLHVLQTCGVYPPAFAEFLEDSIDAHKKVQELSDDIKVDFKVIQAEMLLAAIRS